ncbi:vWA domain-containing protein [Luteimonas sp. MHLX1A]|uniref:vWA domain-containing protein n=1 Tax=Alterluteimonas muca TaxID=2878684 RepID=UPI001E3BD746|nr:VWA domain-containing protein [Luteimonas sp. MHLX1A]MCD9046915.1 VWA domain-containing protein [Luteimonas sp. MHLX1A]
MKTEMSPLRRAKAMMGSIPIFAQQLCEGSACQVKFSFGARTAYTDGVTITLPPLPLPQFDEDIEVVEALADLVHCYIPHEVGHIRYSSFKEIREAATPILKSLLNAIEDPRMELDLIATFPGTRGQLDRGLERLASMGHFDVLTSDVEPDQLLALYTLYYLRGHLRQSEEFVERAEQSRGAIVGVFGEAFVERLEILLDSDGMDMLSTADAYCLAQAIVKAVQEAQKDAEAEEEDEPGQDDGAGQSADQGAEPGDDADGSEDQSGAGGAGDQDGSSSGGDSDQAGNGSGRGTGLSRSEAFDKVLRADSVSCQDLGDLMSEELRKAQDTALDQGMDKVIAETVDGTTNFEMAPKNAGFNPDEATKASRQLKARLRALMQTLTMSRTTEAVRGSRIHSRRAYRSDQYNRRMFIHQDDDKGVETAVYLLCDRSGSMAHQIGPARNAVYAIGDAMASLPGVKVGAGLFPSNRVLFPIGQKPSVHIDRMPFYACGSTPMAEGISWAMRQLWKRREPRKILMVLTDGKPDNEPHTDAMIAAAEAVGIEVHAVGIGSFADLGLFKSSCLVESIDELPAAVLGMLEVSLTRKQFKRAA